MKSNAFSILLLFFISCTDSKSHNGGEPTVRQAEKTHVQTSSIDSIPSRLAASEDQLKEIKKCLSKDYAIKDDEVLSFEEIESGRNKIYLLKIESNTPIEAWGGDPVANLLIIYEGQNYYTSTPSVYAEDFNLVDKQNEIVVFEYYSSPVGYTQLIISDLSSKKFYLSDKILETEKVNLKSIDLSKKEFNVTNERKQEITKNIQIKLGYSCEN